jgi:hypothetical protein
LGWKVGLMTRNPPKLLRVAGMLLICLTLFALAGGHWAVLQTIAWAQMLRDYSKNVTIAEAIVRTFSGGSPCGMCTKITTERQKEEKAPAIVKLEKKGRNLPFHGARNSQRTGGQGLFLSGYGRNRASWAGRGPTCPHSDIRLGPLGRFPSFW